MNYNLSKWLKDDVGLKHLSESDVNCLVYHPTNGSLCRRSIALLAESTLCSRKYPDVFAAEHYEYAKQELKRKTEDLNNLTKQIELYTKNNENEERRLSFLKLKLDYLESINDLQRTSAEALQEIADRPNLEIDQIARNIEECQYLSKSDLATIYSAPELTRLERPIVKCDQLATSHDITHDLINEIEVIQSAISKAFQKVVSKLDKIDINNLRPITAKIEDLIAIKEPKFEEVSIRDLDAEECLELYNKTTKKVSELNQEVRELNGIYKKDSKNDELVSLAKRRIERCVKDLEILEDITRT